MSDNPQQDDSLFELFAHELAEAEEPAPPRVKARLYSALIRRQETSGPLRSLDETRSQGYGLCFFESFWERAASGEAAQSLNCCSLCHARVLAERLEKAPIFWGNCPYVSFGKK